MEPENKNENNQKSTERLLAIGFFLIIITVVAVTFIRYYILKDYYIEAQTNCDPETERCFTVTCDPETDDTCPKDPSEQTTYYKIIDKKAYLIPLCDPESEGCPELACNSGEDCQEILCDETTVAEQEEAECNDPEEYKQKMKSEEENETCSPNDEDCINEENPEDSEEESADSNNESPE